MAREIITAEREEREKFQESVLRPRNLNEFVGQTEVKRQLDIFIRAAKVRADTLDHTIFHGHPGLGKTTLAYILSEEMGTNIKCTSGPVIERPVDLAALLSNLNPGDILFIDEIHRLSPVVEEILYPAMEDFKLDIMVGQGPGARAVRLELPRFTLVGATTRVGLLTPPLRDRFGIQLRLDFYKPEDLALMVKRVAARLNTDLTEDGAVEIARRSRGTPRIAGRLLKRVRDYADVKNKGRIDEKTAAGALTVLGIDGAGLDRLDHRVLSTICQKYRGGPVGLEALAATIAEEAETIAEVCEPYLIQEGYVLRTARGRMTTPKAFAHMGIELP
ncbi:MAG: Holliday junction branch migration DNA helicase RuvB [Deltaproteobacteria bacterium]|jgi:Holliday junction DNA helicase RuvB|nr:Holliday junction branch migration DNA helicase RuvB [Deltaproteobacteria bacterium]